MRQLQRAEPGAATLRLRITDNHEVLGPAGPDLEPTVGAPCPIGGVRPLGHDSFQPELLHLLVEDLTLALEVIEITGRVTQLDAERVPSRKTTSTQAYSVDSFGRVRNGRSRTRSLPFSGARDASGSAAVSDPGGSP